MASALVALAGALWVGLPADAQALDIPGVGHVERVALPGCDFVVFVPALISRSEVTVEHLTTEIVHSVYDPNHPKPYMRVECLPSEGTDGFSHDALKGLLFIQATNAGLESPELTVEDGALGMTGTYAGVRPAGPSQAKVFGKIVIGRGSILHLMVAETPESFPSTETVYFLNTINARRPALR